MDDRLKAVNHVVCLLSEALEVIEAIRNAPESPVTSYLPAEVRRTFRRNAGRLRRGRLHPRYANRYSPEELAAVLESAAKRDEKIEQGFVKLTRIEQEIRRVFAYQRAEIAEGTTIVYRLAQQRAQEDGPESQAADFLRLFQEMIAKGVELSTEKRRQKDLAPPEPFRLPGADPDRVERDWISAAEIVAGAPRPDERVLHFTTDSTVSDEPPLILRIGIGDRSWVGSFPRGTTEYTTVQLMPDGAHLLVVARGAGYVVEAVTRELAREAGKDIMDVLLDEEAGLLILDRGNVYFEAFGWSGPLWKTGRVGSGAFAIWSSETVRSPEKRSTASKANGRRSPSTSGQAKWRGMDAARTPHPPHSGRGAHAGETPALRRLQVGRGLKFVEAVIGASPR